MANRRAVIIEVVRFGDHYRMDVTKSADSYNGLLYKDGELVQCVAVGLHEGIKWLKAKALLYVEEIREGSFQQYFVRTATEILGPYSSKITAEERAKEVNGYVDSRTKFIKR